MKFKFRHADKFVGLFFIVSMVFVFTSLIIVGSNQRWFSSDVTYRSRFPTADGLSRNMSIRLSGFEIGKVVSFELNQNNEVDMIFVVYEEYTDRIHPGSVLEMKSNPLGLSSGMALYPGKKREYLLTEGSFIPRISSFEGQRLVRNGLVDMPGGSDPIGAVMESVEPLINDVQTTIRLVNNTLESVDIIAASFAYAVQGGDERPLGRVMDNLADSTTSIEQLIADLQTPDGIVRRLIGADGSIATLLDDDNQLYNSIYRSLTSVEEGLSGVGQAGQNIGNSSAQLEVLMVELLAAIEDARKVMEGVRNNPLLRGGIQEERQSQTNETGYRNAEF